MKLFYIPFIIQGVVMAADEFWAHEQRSLPRWERIGHPLDSLTVLLAFLYLLIFPYEEARVAIFVGLALFSCVFITKDEFVHSKECHGFEHWLHSLLFILHPVVFFCAAGLWQAGDRSFLLWQTIIVGVFMFYQIIRWSIPWPQPNK